MSAASEVLIAQPFLRDQSIRRVKRLSARYDAMRSIAGFKDGRTSVKLLIEHPGAALELRAIDADELETRASMVRTELRELRGAAPLPAPIERTERTRILALADFSWFVRELRPLRFPTRSSSAVLALYASAARLDPIEALTLKVLDTLRTVPRSRILDECLRAAGVRHGVDDLRGYLLPAPAAQPQRIRAGTIEEIGKRAAFEVGGRRIGLLVEGDQLFAFDDACPHRGGPLHQGSICEGVVSCPDHGWRFDLETGKMIGNDRVCVRTYPIEIEGDEVFVTIGD